MGSSEVREPALRKFFEDLFFLDEAESAVLSLRVRFVAGSSWWTRRNADVRLPEEKQFKFSWLEAGPPNYHHLNISSP